MALLLLAELTQMSGVSWLMLSWAQLDQLHASPQVSYPFAGAQQGHVTTGTRVKISQERAFQAIGHNTLANIPLASASHVINPQTKE